jgi:hypothetical protein
VAQPNELDEEQQRQQDLEKALSISGLFALVRLGRGVGCVRVCAYRVV